MATPVNILSLPLDLLGEIVKHMDWRELQVIKLTCKALYGALQSRHLWHILADEMEHKSCVPRNFGGNLQEYTTQELQQWVLRRLRARECWSSGSGYPATVRTRLFRRDRSMQPGQLLPGGRWRITMNATYTRMYAYDLDSPERGALEPILLFDVGEKDNHDETLDILGDYRLWIDPSGNHNPSFRVLVWRIACPEVPSHVTRTCIYRIDIQGHGPAATFGVKCLAILRSYDRVNRPAAAISAKHLVELRRVSMSQLELSLQEYAEGKEESTGNQQLRVTLAARDEPVDMQITAQNHIIVLSTGYVDIYTISQVQGHNLSVHLSPLHIVPIHIEPSYYYGPFAFHGISWIVTAYTNKLKLTRLPLNTDMPLMKELGEISFVEREYMSRIGPCSSVFLRPNWSFDIVTYTWNTVQATCTTTFVVKYVQVVQPKGYDLGAASRWFIWQVDKDMGRIVLYKSASDDCMIVDIF